MIYVPVDYLKKARELAARRARPGGATPPVTPPAIPHTGEECRKTPEYAPTCPPHKATRKHALITDREQLKQFAALFGDAQRIALDTETYPMDDSNSALDPRRGRVRLISVAAEGGVGGVVDVAKVHPGPLLETLRHKTLIAHNASFDLAFLKNRFGYEHDGPVSDTQVLDAILYYADGPRKETVGWRGFPKNEEVRRRSLKDVATDYLDTELSKEEQTSDFGRDRLSEAQVHYAMQDSEILLPLEEAMMRRARKLDLQRVAKLETRVVPALAYCQNNGFALDAEGWRAQAREAAEEIEGCQAECETLAPPPQGKKRGSWNWNSDRQVAEVLELLGAELPKTPNGNSKTDKATLEAVASPKAAVRFARVVLRLRGAKKRLSTCGPEWFDTPKRKPGGKRFDKDHSFVVDGRVFSSFNQVIKTGRMSSSKPNLQNVHPKLKRYFVAPPGRKLVIADYKNIELVMAGVIAKEEKLLAAFRRGDDVHSLTARGILEAQPERGGHPVSEDEVRRFRPLAKHVSFAILYGSTAKGLAEGMTGKFGEDTSEEGAQALIDLFFDTYPKLASWYRKERARARAGEDRTRTLTGRLRLLDVKYCFGKWRPSPQVRLNTPIQGSAGDGFKHALALTWERRGECLGFPMVVNLVHDEIVVEIDEAHAEAGKAWLEQCMLDGMAFVVGDGGLASVEIAIGDNWGEK